MSWAKIVMASVISVGAVRAETATPRITHGVASGEVTATSAVVWARADRPARMTVHYAASSTSGIATRARSVQREVTAASDFAGQVILEPLEPATSYAYEVTFIDAEGAESPAERGSFRTAPADDQSAPVSFIVGGDLGGQSYCRRAEVGYPIFAAMADLEADFFVANGDLIYADGTCPETGPEPGWRNLPGDFPSIASPDVNWLSREELREVYLAHWRYNRADPQHQAFLRRTPMYVQWDDHEVINDFGAPWRSWLADSTRAGFANLVVAGRESLFDFNPLSRPAEDPQRLYRSFTWGKELELFLLDARSYRSLNDLPDRPEHDKTLLGIQQLEWLKRGLASSQATWKIVSSDVTLSVPTGSDAHRFGRDSWANGVDDDFSAETGFERELLDLMRFLDASDVHNVVFVATDVHFALSLRYAIDVDGDGDALVLFELISGPLTAGRRPAPIELDPTLRPTVLYAEGQLFNFGFVRLERNDRGTFSLVADVRDESGEVRFGSRLVVEPAPQAPIANLRR